MSFEKLTAIAREQYETRAHEQNTIRLNSATRAVLREKCPPAANALPSAQFTEALEMSAARNGIPFMGLLGSVGIRIWIDDSLPANVWKLTGANGEIIQEGTLD